MLKQNARSSSSVVPVVRRKTSPFVATLLSIVPGLGAAYNGQTSKAIVHFAIFASFFQMATVTDGMAFFTLGVIGTWLFSAVDACRTAQLMRAGLAPDEEEDAIARRLYGNPLAWSIMLIVLGIIFLLHTLLGIRLPVKQFLPVVLVILGSYMLLDYLRRRSVKRERGTLAFDTHHPPPSVVSAPLDASRFRTGELITQVSARDVPFEPRP
jgi:hypothetical protein